MKVTETKLRKKRLFFVNWRNHFKKELNVLVTS